MKNRSYFRQRFCVLTLFIAALVFQLPQAEAHFGILTPEEYLQNQKALTEAREATGKLTRLQFQFMSDEFFKGNWMTLVHLKDDRKLYVFSNSDLAQFVKAEQFEPAEDQYHYDVIDLNRLDIEHLAPIHRLKITTSFLYRESAQQLHSDRAKREAVSKYIENKGKRLGTYTAEGAATGLALPFYASWMAGYQGFGRLAEKMGGRDPITMGAAFTGGMFTTAVGLAPSIALSPVGVLIGSVVGIGNGIKHQVLKKRHEAEFKKNVLDCFAQTRLIFSDLHSELGDNQEDVLNAVHEMLLAVNFNEVKQIEGHPGYLQYFANFKDLNNRTNKSLLLRDLDLTAKLLSLHQGFSEGPRAWEKLAHYLGIPLTTGDQLIDYLASLYFLTKNDTVEEVLSTIIED